MISNFRLWCGAFLNGLAELVFACRPLSGILVLVALALLSPWILLGAVAGAAVGTSLGYFLPTARAHWLAGLTGFNPAILGILWAGKFQDGIGEQVLFVALLVICVLTELVMRRLLEPLALRPFSAPAFFVAVLASFSVAPAGSWLWTGTTEQLIGPAGIWIALACMALAMAVEARAAAAWAICFGLGANLTIQMLGIDHSYHAGLWGFTIPLSCFAAMTLFGRDAPLSLVAGVIAVVFSTSIWILWVVCGLYDQIPPLVAPLVLGLWATGGVMKQLGGHPMFQPSFWTCVSRVSSVRRSRGRVITVTGPGAAEASLLAEFGDSNQHVTGGALWQMGNRLRRVAKQAAPEPIHRAVIEAKRIGMITHTLAGDALGLLNKAGCIPDVDLAGEVGRVRCTSCGKSSVWPAAGLWRRMVLRCAKCSGPLEPDLRYGRPMTPIRENNYRLVLLLQPPGLLILTEPTRLQIYDFETADAVVDAGQRGHERTQRSSLSSRQAPGAQVTGPPDRTLNLLVRVWRLSRYFGPIWQHRTWRGSIVGGRWRNAIEKLPTFGPWGIAAVLAIVLLVLETWTPIDGTLAVRADLTAGETGKIYFTSYNSNLDQLEVGGLHGLPVTVSGELTLPAGNAEPAPAVVLVHGSLGLTGLQQRYVELLTGSGFAVFAIDSFTGRGIADTVGNQTALDGYSMMIDAFVALELLASHPEIDSQRIAITGWSKGGGVAQLALTRRYRNILAPDGLEFAAHVAIYPWCGEQEVQPELTGAPILYLLAGADDWVGAQSCIDYSKRLADDGYPAKSIVYPDAEHGFDDRGHFRLLVDRAVSWADCQYFARHDGFVIAESGKFHRWSEIDGYLSSCTMRMAHLGTNTRARAAATDQLLLFLQETLM